MFLPISAYRCRHCVIGSEDAGVEGSNGNSGHRSHLACVGINLPAEHCRVPCHMQLGLKTEKQLGRATPCSGSAAPSKKSQQRADGALVPQPWSPMAEVPRPRLSAIEIRSIMNLENRIFVKSSSPPRTKEVIHQRPESVLDGRRGFR